MKESGTQTQAFVEIGALDGIQVDVYIIGSVWFVLMCFRLSNLMRSDPV